MAADKRRAATKEDYDKAFADGSIVSESAYDLAVESNVKDCVTKEWPYRLPKPVSFGRMKNLPPMPDALIEGALVVGGKAMLAAPYKAGKTFCAMDLAISVCTGKKWMGHYKCKKGNVGYINLEVGDAQFFNRMERICKAKDIERESLDDSFKVINGRANGLTLGDGFEDDVIGIFADTELDLLIIDTMYKAMSGDENTAKDVIPMTRALDEIAEALGCATLLVHHFSKGSQGNKSAGDRPSGSGVFARDVDALFTLTEVENDKDGCPIYRLETVLRDFESSVIEVRWDFPLFQKVDGYEQAEYKSGNKGSNKARENAEKRHNRIAADATAIYKLLGGEDGCDVARQDFDKRYKELHNGTSDNMLNDWFSKKNADWFPYMTTPVKGLGGKRLVIPREETTRD